MRVLSSISVVAILILGCGSEAGEPTSLQNDSMRSDSIARAHEMSTTEKNFTEFALTDPIMVDVNGDGIEDTLRFDVDGPHAGKVLITRAGSNEVEMLVCEMDNGEFTSEFTFASNWGLLLDKTTYTTYAVDGELRDSVFTLENPAIKLWQDGGGSGFFTFKGGKWIWRTTGC